MTSDLAQLPPGRAYAWSLGVEGAERLQYVAVLHRGPVDSPQAAVRGGYRTGTQMPSVESGTRKTTRLLLLPWSDEYLDDLARIYADPEVMPYITGGRTLSRDACVKWSERYYRLWEEYGYSPWAVIDVQ